MSDFIPVNEPLLNGNEKKYLIQCIDTGWISSEGPFIKEFEEKFLSDLRLNGKKLLEEIVSKRELNDGLTSLLEKTVKKVLGGFIKP